MEISIWVAVLIVVSISWDRIRFGSRLEILERKHEGLRNTYGAELTRLEKLIDQQAAKLRESTPPRDGDAQGSNTRTL